MQINEGRAQLFYLVYLQGSILTSLLTESLEANGYPIMGCDMVSSGERLINWQVLQFLGHWAL